MLARRWFIIIFAITVALLLFYSTRNQYYRSTMPSKLTMKPVLLDQKELTKTSSTVSSRAPERTDRLKPATSGVPSENRTTNMNLNLPGSPVHLVFIRPTWMPLPQTGEWKVEGCDVPCFYSGDNSRKVIEGSSGLVFLLHQLLQIPWNTAKSEDPDVILKNRRMDPNSFIKIGMSLESTKYFWNQFDLISKYDIEYSYRQKSDVFRPYFQFPEFNLLENQTKWEERKSAAVFVANNCHSSNSRREEFVRMLQKHIPVDSVSGCLHNKDWPPDVPRSDKIGLLKRYKVYLAAENSIENDYVTEKVYQGLVAGSVPIYLGAPNIKEFVPSNSTIIVPGNFTETDVAKIGELAQKIFTDRAEYEQWTSFKRYGLDEWFKQRFSFTRHDSICRVCRRVLAQKGGYRWDHEKQQIVY